MKLIMKTEFDNLRLNNAHSYDSNTNTDKQVVRIYCGEQLIAKMIKQKKSIRYFGADNYQHFLTDQ
ncbi:MAG: hypothetical protein COB35_14140 [Gammaproteobacteria bacterium]|nr:MAG: hypothetical protein COB35_14140 [Gammaproteobacteria bacterium]